MRECDTIMPAGVGAFEVKAGESVHANLDVYYLRDGLPQVEPVSCALVATDEYATGSYGLGRRFDQVDGKLPGGLTHLYVTEDSRLLDKWDLVLLECQEGVL